MEPWHPRLRPGPQASNPPDLWVPGELETRAALLARARAGDVEALRLVEERYRVRLHVTAPAPALAPARTPARPTAEDAGGAICDGCGEPMVDRRRRRGAPKRYHGPTCRNRAYRRKHRSAA